MGKKASKHLPERLDASGNISRRSFLDRTGKVALAGLSAGAMFETPTHSSAWAQQASDRCKSEAGTRPLRLLADHRPAGHQVAEQRARGLLGRAQHRVVRIHAAEPADAARHPQLFLPRLRQPRRLLADAGGHGQARHPLLRLPERGRSWTTARRSATPWSSANWDYMAHGFYNTRPITAYSIEEERAYWRDIIATVKKHTGKQLKGRLGAGGGNTVNTADLMAEFGLLYHTDWLMDDQPFPLKVKNGAKFIHVPVQLSDQRRHRDRARAGTPRTSPR